MKVGVAIPITAFVLVALWLAGVGSAEALETRDVSIEGEAGRTAGAHEGYRIIVGPEVLVSRDPYHPHAEMLIAANPTDAANLMATSLVSTANGIESRVAASNDGGNTWTWFTPPEQQENGGVDQVIAFGPTGSAYFLSRQSSVGYDLHRSQDGGRTWTLMQSGLKGWHHPWVGVDLSDGPHRGNLYVAYLKGGLVISGSGRIRRSTDDGRSFEPESLEAPWISSANGAFLVMSDGTLLSVRALPRGGYVYSEEGDLVSKRGEGPHVLTVTSANGGLTWSEPTKASLPYKPPPQSVQGEIPTRLIGLNSQMAAVDGWPGSPFEDRIYLAWVAQHEDRSRILVSASDDRGKSWGKPVPLSPDEASYQFSVTVATNKDGVLGVMYSDTQGHRPEDEQFDTYFAASVDGGHTFLPPQRLSSQPSKALTAAHSRPILRRVIAGDAPGGMGADTLTISLWDHYQKFPTGGDYLGLAADIDGVFHPLWADSRSGVYQAYTSRVSVTRAAEIALLTAGLSDPGSLDLRLRLEVDPVRFDSTAHTATMPVRLRNVSADPVFGPVTVRIKAIRQGATLNPSSIQVLNSRNGVTGAGAFFDFSGALGDLGMLPPDSVSSAVEWRVTVPEHRYETFEFEVEMTGRLRK